MNAKTFLFVIPLIIVAPEWLSAFRVDTHVLIAQDIVDDLVNNNGNVTFPVSGSIISIRAAPGVFEAVADKRFRNAFLQGSIGPDAFPGIYEGQMAIHPGSLHGWGSSDYLAFLFQRASSPEQLSFAYGMATHLAADVFAHTYVNAYAGGCWNLTDADETVVEQRHFALEGFVALHNPSAPAPAANLSALLSQPQLSPSTVDYIVTSLFLNETAAKNYNRDCPHVENIVGLQTALRDLIKNDGPLRKLQDVIERAVWNEYVCVPITDKQLHEFRKLRQRWKTLETKGLKEMHQGVDELLKFSNSIHGFAGAARSRQFQALAEAAEAANIALEKRQDLKQQKQDFKSKLKKRTVEVVLEAKKKKDGLVPEVLRPEFVPNKVEKVIRGWFGGGSKKKPAKDEVIEKALKADDQAAQFRYQIEKCEAELQEEFLAFQKNQLKDLQGALNEVDGLIASGIEAAREANAVGAYITSLTNSDTFVLVSVVEKWADDIDVAMKEYVLMNAGVIRVMSDKKANNSQALELLESWMKCQAPKIIGAGPAPRAKCTFEARMEKFLDHWEKLHRRILSAVGLGPVYNQLIEIRQKVETAAREEIRSFVLRQLEPEVKQILELLKGPITEDILRKTFTRSAGKVALVAIPDIASRARGDMGVTASGWFDRDTFAPYRNAVTLSKLALLDGNGLNELAKELGVVAPTEFADGQPLYPAPSDLNSDLRSPSARRAPVLSGAILSIDGNHQWHRYPPPYARRSPPHAPAVPSRLNGFRIWDAQQAREKLFRVLFVGPIAAGLDAPEKPLERILPNDYIWRTCREHPFPDTYANCCPQADAIE
jgi:zinc dependent phospholipase C